MKIFNEKDLIAAITLQESDRKKKLVNTVILNNYAQQNEHVDAFYAQPWCTQVSHDYCPLVITLMSFVCLISLVLIAFIIFRGTIQCTFQCSPFRKCIRTFRKKVFKRATPTNASRLSYDRSIISNSAMDLSSPINRSFFTHVNNFTHVSPERHGQVWFTNINAKPTGVIPPPSYEESQTYTVRNLIKPVPINPVIRSYLHKTTDETVPVPVSTAVFPTYRCITLTSSPDTRASLNRLADMSRQLLEESNDDSNDLETNMFARMGSLHVHNDEVPPAYDSIIGNIVSGRGEVVGTFQGSQQYMSNEFLI